MCYAPWPSVVEKLIRALVDRHVLGHFFCTLSATIASASGGYHKHLCWPDGLVLLPQSHQAIGIPHIRPFAIETDDAWAA